MSIRHDNMTVLDVVVALNDASDEDEISRFTKMLEDKANLNESNTQQHLYAHLSGIVLNVVRSHRLHNSVVSDMEVRARVYEDHLGRPRCALGVAIVPTPDTEVDSSSILKELSSELWNRNLSAFVDDVTVNDEQMFWGPQE